MNDTPSSFDNYDDDGDDPYKKQIACHFFKKIQTKLLFSVVCWKKTYHQRLVEDNQKVI